MTTQEATTPDRKDSFLSHLIVIGFVLVLILAGYTFVGKPRLVITTRDTLPTAMVRPTERSMPQGEVDALKVAPATTGADADQLKPTPLPAPAPLPVDAAPGQVMESAPQPSQFSPVDLGSAPLPTPTSALTQAQLDASAASEEQNFLNNAQQGLTEAQKLVQQHNAEWTVKESMQP